MKGKWAAGIEPRGFTWVYKGILAVSERPGGSTTVHRQVRRDEELLWLKHQGFGRVISILPSMQNMSAYFEHGLTASHYALARRTSAARGPRGVLPRRRQLHGEQHDGPLARRRGLRSTAGRRGGISGVESKGGNGARVHRARGATLQALDRARRTLGALGSARRRS